MADLSKAKTLAGELYYSPDTFADELEQIFFKLWICVGREGDIPAAGDYFTRQIGAESVLVLRDQDGHPRAFYNACRHRGSRLVLDDEGQGLSRVQCPYHAWAYSLDGALVSAPLMDQNPNFQRCDYPMVGIRLETWQGLLFVNLSDEPLPLESQLEGYPDISRFHIRELKRVHRIVYEVEANWKLMAENYGECYHCPLAHPHLNRVSDYRNVGNAYKGPFVNGGPMELNDGCNTMTVSGRTDRPYLTDVPTDQTTAQYNHAYPTFFLSLFPDFAITHTLWPADAGNTRVICDWLFPDRTAAGKDFDPSDTLEFWDLTNKQDWELCSRVQLGVRSRGHRQGPNNELEVCVHTFDSWYLEYMSSQAGLRQAGLRQAGLRQAGLRQAHLRQAHL